MINKKILKLTLAVAFFSPSTHAKADDFMGLNVSANVGLYSQYVFRGIAQSDEGPALQGGFDISNDTGLYAGVWGSNVDFNDGDEASSEIDVYAGYGGNIGNISYDIGAIYYAYPNADSSLNYDFFEGSLAVGYNFDALALSGSVNYSPEYFGNSGDAFYYAAAVDVPVTGSLSASAHIGHQSIDDNVAFGVPNYTDWSLGLGYSMSGFDLSLQYIDTDLDEPNDCADGCEARVVFGISRSF